MDNGKEKSSAQLWREKKAEKRRQRYATDNARRRGPTKQQIKDAKAEKRREMVRISTQKYRERINANRQADNDEPTTSAAVTFGLSPTSRKRVSRAAKKITEILPHTPSKTKAAATLNLVLNHDKTIKRKLVTPTTPINTISEVDQAIIDDCRDLIKDTNKKRSSEKTASMKVLAATLLGGENTSGLKRKAAKRLGFRPCRTGSAVSDRLTFLRSKKAISLFSKCAVRKDRITDTVRQKIIDFWSRPSIARSTGNKKDVVRQRLGLKTYVEHERLVLEMTIMEAYDEFKKEFDISISFSMFARLKPFYVRSPRRLDQVSCCCRQHVEIRMLFRKCMEYRQRSIPAEADVYQHISDLVATTLCRSDGSTPKRECLNRECPDCGVENFQLSDDEKDKDSEQEVKWRKFSYVGTPPKLTMLDMETSPYLMFQYFISLLKPFPAHNFRAEWQRRQLHRLIEALPQNHAIAIHDYSENYTCTYQNEIQTLYYGQHQASIHVTILMYHSPTSTDENPDIQTEHIFTISDDIAHNSHSVHDVRSKVNSYLNENKIQISTLHEFTDGCSAQYKSRHCLGDVSYSYSDFNYITIRNFFETSHAKGPQDGAGANIKHKASMDVIRERVVIRNGRELYDHLNSCFTSIVTQSTAAYPVKKRVFFFADNIDHQHRLFKIKTESLRSRRIHQVVSATSSQSLQVRDVSCYCGSCLYSNYDSCENSAYVDSFKTCELSLLSSTAQQSTSAEPEPEPSTSSADPEPSPEDDVDECIAMPGTFVAIASGDSHREYYIAEVIEGAQRLASNVTDDYGNSYTTNSLVLKCQLLELKDELRSAKYFSKESKTTFIYQSAIKYICTELERCERNHKPMYKLLKTEECDILLSCLS